MNLRQISIKDQIELKKVYFDSIQSLDDTGITTFVGSYSKMVVPGFRLGYLVASDSILKIIEIIF